MTSKRVRLSLSCACWIGQLFRFDRVDPTRGTVTTPTDRIVTYHIFRYKQDSRGLAPPTGASRYGAMTPAKKCPGRREIGALKGDHLDPQTLA